MTDLQYPIGQFSCPEIISEDIKQEWIDTLENFPVRLENLVKNLSEQQLNTPYREEG